MCDTQTLAYSSEGYIIRCAQCRRMQMAFGPVAVLIKEQQFYRLRAYAEIEIKNRKTAVFFDPELKFISLSLNPSTLLCLSFRELQSLKDLLDQAHALLEVYEMLAI